MSLLIDTSFLWNETVWNPSMISTALWLDAADATTVTQSGGLVSQVNDKSGNGRIFTASSGARPTYTSSGLNGLPVLTLGGSQYLTSTSTAATWNFMHNTNGCTFWIVGKAGNISNPVSQEYFFIGNNATASANTGATFYYSDYDYGGGKNNDLAVDVIGRGISGQFTSFNISSNNALAANTPFLASVARDPGNATAANRSSIYINGGTVITQNTLTNAPSSGDATYALQIGAAGNNVAPVTGYISEVIISPSIVSTLNRQKIEGYLAHKWGLGANLPVGHPYKTVGPKP